MPQDDKVVYMKRFGHVPRGVAERYRQLADGRLAALLNDMLDGVDDALFDRAERAEGSGNQSAYFTAMRQMRLQRKQLEQAFRDALRAGHQQASGNAEEPAWEQGLSLVDNERLEEELAIEAMVSKAKTRSSKALDHLCQRVNQLEPGAPVDPDTLAVGPARLCATFADVISPLQLELQPRLVIYKLFERHVINALGTLYDELNRMLADAGVLPVIESDGKKPSRPQPRASEPAPSTQRTPPPGDSDGAAALLSVLQKLVSAGTGGDSAAHGKSAGTGSAGSGGGAGTVGGGVGSGAVMGGEQVLSVLSGLQQGTQDGPPRYLSAEQIKELLRRSAGLDGAELSPETGGTIDLVSLLFDAMLDEPYLLQSLKELISRLQIPTIKVALLDHALFSRKQHAARRLINEMAGAGLGWTDPEQAEKDPLYRRIETLVNDVLVHFRDDLRQLQQALEEFQAFMAEERERAAQIEQRTRQAAEGKARVEEARERVDAEVKRVIADRPVPEVVQRLLDEAWSKVLFISLLKEGQEGSNWRHQLGVVDRLVWSVQPKASHEERKQLVAEIPGLLHELRAGMNAVMFNPVDMTRMFKELEREHIQVLTRPLAKADELRREAELAAEERESLTEPAQSAERRQDELQPYRERLDAAEVGTWFEFRPGEGKAIRARLSMRLTGGERLIFVNRAGFKLAERRREELAEALRRGQVAILDHGELFDRALEAVVHNLRKIQSDAD